MPGAGRDARGRPGRRLVLLGAAATSAGALAGCGFHPLYATGAGGASSPVAAELAAVYVPVIGERAGQLIRQALQRRFEGAGTGAAKRYELELNYSLAGEGIAVQRDNSTTRIRLVGIANWTLRTLSLERKALTTGTARVLDGFNILNQQYFAAELENQAATQRVAEALADQVTLKLGAWFQQQAPAPA